MNCILAVLHFHITVLFSFYVIFLSLPYGNIATRSEEEDAYEWLYDLLMRMCHKQKGWIRPCHLLFLLIEGVSFLHYIPNYFVSSKKNHLP